MLDEVIGKDPGLPIVPGTKEAPGVKFDGDKIDMALLPDFGLALMAAMDQGSFGSEKYSVTGWRCVPDGERRYLAAGLGHLMKSKMQMNDPETGVDELAVALWNIMASLQLKIENTPRLKKQYIGRRRSIPAAGLPPMFYEETEERCDKDTSVAQGNIKNL